MKKPDPKILSFVQDVVSGRSYDLANLEQARQLLRAKCKKDLWFFSYHGLEFRDIDTDLHHDMCNRWMARNSALFSLWQVPRGHLKTSLWTEAGTLWDLLNNPNERHLIVSAKLETAQDILANIRNYVETRPIFRWLFPEYCGDQAAKILSRRCYWGKERLDFPCSRQAGRKEGNIECMGVEASMVSMHYDKMTFDDIVNDLNSGTKAYRDKIWSWYKNSLQLLHDPSISRVRVIGTRWNFDDIYCRLEKQELKRRKRFEDLGKKVKPFLWIYRRAVVEKAPHGEGIDIVGKQDVLPVWPQRFTPGTIENLKHDRGTYIFSCQYMNDPLPEENTIFKRTHIREVEFFDIPENVINFLAVDMAAEDNPDSDYTALVVASFDVEGRMYVREIINDRLMPDKTLTLIAHLTEKWDCKRVAIETQCFQSIVLKNYKEKAAKLGWNIPWVEMKRGSTMKAKRFLAMQPRVERGDFLYEEDIQNVDDMIDQMVTYSLTHKPAFDDILDCLADLERLFYSAPEQVVEKKDFDTYDAFYGSLFDEDVFSDDKEPSSILGTGISEALIG